MMIRPNLHVVTSIGLPNRTDSKISASIKKINYEIY